MFLNNITFHQKKPKKKDKAAKYFVSPPMTREVHFTWKSPGPICARACSCSWLAPSAFVDELRLLNAWVLDCEVYQVTNERTNERIKVVWTTKLN